MMYSELLLIQQAGYEFIPQIERAEDLLRHVWDRYFADAEVKPLDAWAAEDVGLVLRTCMDTLRVAVLAYRLAAGEDAPDVAEFFKDAAQYQTAHELNRLVEAAQRKEREEAPGHHFSAALAGAYDMPAQSAIKFLGELLEGGGADAGRS